MLTQIVMKMNVKNSKKYFLSILLFLTLLIYSCAVNNNSDKITYWKDKDKSILVETKDSIYLYFDGFLNGIKFKKGNTSKYGNAKLTSGKHEYSLFFNLPYTNANPIYINYRHNNTDMIEIEVKMRDNYNLFRYEKLNNIINWDSLILENYNNDNLYVRKTLLPGNNPDINVFCTFVSSGISNNYSPSTSSSSKYKLFLYLSNGEIIKEEMTVLPIEIGRNLFKDIKRVKRKSPKI